MTSIRMKLCVYFVRHGETTANRDYILQGHCDYPLTELGESQSLAVGRDLKNVHWQKIYSSDLPRAVNTTNLLLSQSVADERKVILSEYIREIAYGVREGLSRRFSAEDAKREYAKIHNMKVEDVVDTAESTDNVKERQRQFIMQILHDYLADSLDVGSNNSTSSSTISSNGHVADCGPPILCVSHGGYIKLFLRTFCKLSKVDKIDNCSVSMVTIEWHDINKPLEYECSVANDCINRSPSSL